MTEHSTEFDIRDLKIDVVDITVPKAFDKSPRRKTRQQIEEMARSIDEFQMSEPILIDEYYVVIAGEVRLEACRLLGFDSIPVIVLRHLNETQKRAFRIAHNRLCEKGEWDLELLAENFRFIAEDDYKLDLEFTAFDCGYIDVLLEGGSEAIAQAAQRAAETLEEIELSEPDANPISRLNDRFEIGDHVIVCGDATDEHAYRLALGRKKADLGLTDPPYNVPARHISGKGKVRHKDFVQGFGELSSSEFQTLIGSAGAQIEAHSKAGSYSLFFTAWYSLADIMAACSSVFGALSHICIWAKTNGGMGFPWRNAWEGILVYRKAGARPRNNVQLGRFGRNRTDVFRYAGANVFRKGRMKELSIHPTCKPVELLKDVILDLTPIGGIVLDPFLGSGSTILAAHAARRRGVGIELDPRYVDVAIMRAQDALGIEAVRQDGLSYNQLRTASKGEAE